MGEASYLRDIQTYAKIFVLAGILMGIGIYTISQIDTQFPDQTTTNQTINFAANNTFYDFADRPVVSVSQVANTSFVLNAANFDWNENQIRIIGHLGNVTTGNYNVTFTAESSVEHRSIQNSTRGIGNMSSYLGLIGIVLAAIIIIGLLTALFVNKVAP